MFTKSKIVKKWWRDIQAHKSKIFFSLMLLVIAIILNIASSRYTTRVGSCASTDLILDQLPPINLNFVFVYGFMLTITLFFVYPLLMKINKLHQAIYYFSLITIVRSIFITFTHLKTPVGAVQWMYPWPLNNLAFENDMFFSGHAAIPFMGFLVFKKDRIRYIFLGFSILLALTVLAMHQHYSIDVFAAYFIAYGTFHIGEWLTRKIKEMHVKYF